MAFHRGGNRTIATVPRTSGVAVMSMSFATIRSFQNSLRVEFSLTQIESGSDIRKKEKFVIEEHVKDLHLNGIRQ